MSKGKINDNKKGNTNNHTNEIKKYEGKSRKQ